MPSSHPVQTQGNFLGGQWDTIAQGRFDHPWHKSAMNASLNGLPVESGGWVKRSGTQWLGPTYGRYTAFVRTFFADSDRRYMVSLTTNGSQGFAHFFHEDQVLTNGSANVGTSSIASGVLTITTDTATGWAVGDNVIFSGLSNSGGPLLNRWFYIDSISGTTITLKDDVDAALLFSSGDAVGAKVNRIARFTTGFLGNLSTCQIVNIGIQSYGGPIEALLLCEGYAPQLIAMTVSTSGGVTTVSFAVSAATFTDGPYLDPQGYPGTLETGTVSAYSGSITFTPASTTFTSTDVGRQIRLYSQPAAWASGTAYSNGNLVTYNGSWWQYVGGATYAAISGVVPGTLYTNSSGVQVLLWAPYPTAGQWAYGTISAQATTSCTVSLTTPLASANGSTISQWRLGSFNTTYPTSGRLYQGRLYLGGAREGRIDASMSGQYLTFSPTDTNGNVFDNHALDLQLAAETQDFVQWFSPDRSGLMIGTIAEEYILTSGTSDGVITPSNYQLKRMSNYGSLGPQAVVDAGFSTVFVQAGGKIVYEYVTDAFTTAPSGRVLNEFSRSLVDDLYGITELAYVETRVPLVWAMTGDGLLLSCTYRRFSRFMSSPPDMAGWARHQLADLKRVVQSITSLDNHDQSWDFLYLSTTTTGGINPVGPANGIELMQPMEPS